MEINIIKKDNEETILNMENVSCSVTGLYFKNGEVKILFKDIKKIMFNEYNMISQMAEAIVDMCKIEESENNHRILLGLYR